MQTGVRAIDRNVELTHLWLKELAGELHDVEQEEAWYALRAVLQTLRDRLGVNEAAGLAAQLPTMIRGAYYDAWHPASAPHKWRHKDEYFQAVRAHIGGRENLDPEESVRAVLKILARHIDRAEIEKIKTMHNKELWDLWPSAEASSEAGMQASAGDGELRH